MDVLDLFFKKYSYKFSKGYPDMSNNQDVLLLESLLEKLGVKLDLQELVKLNFEDLSPEATKVAQDLMDTIGITQDQIKPSSANNIVVYDDNRDLLVDKTEESGKFGKRGGTRPQRGNFKVGKVSIVFKPLKKSGEYYELKPQQLGVTLDSYIPLDTLKTELIKGINNNDKLEDLQKEFLLALITGENTLTSEEQKEVMSETRFLGEVLKNLGEPLGAILYGEQIGATDVFFPKAGNYPLIDYLLKTPEGEVQVSAKTAKGKGNTIKPGDLLKIIDKVGDDIDSERKEILTIINDNDVKTGSLKLIPKYGDEGLKKQYEDFIKNNPGFPKNGTYNPSDRLALEREMVRQLNKKYDFSDLFNKYVSVAYVKYNLDNNAKPSIKVTRDEGFKVKFKSKNSPGHDQDKLGFEI